MYEINFVVWPGIYGVTGWAIGGLFGMGVVGAVVGVVLGYVTGFFMVAMLFYDIEILAPMVFVPVVILVPAPVKLWLMGAVCLSPWVRMIPRAVSARADATATGGRGAEAAQCAAYDDLVPYLVDDAEKVRSAARKRLDALAPPHDEQVRGILKYAGGIDRTNPKNRKKVCRIYDLVEPLAEQGNDARDALLELYGELGWIRDAVGRYASDGEDADLLVGEVLFERLTWEDDAPLLEVAERRIARGWGVDAMVDRLRDSDLEACLDMTERAFLAGSLAPERLDALGDERAGGVLQRAVRRGSEEARPRWDDIIDGALARPTGQAFSLLASVLRVENDDDDIDSRTEMEFLNVEDGHLSRRDEVPEEAAELLDAVRIRIAWLQELTDSRSRSYKLDVMRRLEEALTD